MRQGSDEPFVVLQSLARWRPRTRTTAHHAQTTVSHARTSAAVHLHLVLPRIPPVSLPSELSQGHQRTTTRSHILLHPSFSTTGDHSLSTLLPPALLASARHWRARTITLVRHERLEHRPPPNLADFLFARGWISNGSQSSTAPLKRPAPLTRSVTPSARPSPASQRLQIPLPHRLYKSKSAASIRNGSMAAVMATPPMHALQDDQIMDTRTPSPIHRTESNGTTTTEDAYKPDLSAEVAMLSTKLVNAINYQTNLDDSLQQTRIELERANQELEQAQSEVATERAAREAAEKSKKQTEAELENLTVSLFEEANTMVAAARKESEDAVAAVEKRNAQLRAQLSDTELLLESQREQLQDLKATMEKMERSSEQDVLSRNPSAPSTPVSTSHPHFDATHLGESISDISPQHPLHFGQVLSPVLRHDISSYGEFLELLAVARLYRGTHALSRNGSYTNSNGTAANSQTNLASTLQPSPGMPGSFSFSTGNSPQSSTTPQVGPPLKECKYYKRSVVEDLEPTLRLDLAPGLSFLSRRTVLSSLLHGTLVVEPFTPQTKFYGPVFPCALCGESRKSELYVRKHRFRTSEEESAQRYPLCDYCLGRIRAAGDFVGFLRTVRDGHWKADNEEEQKSAWEESVRLRERMFWARLGGGVVPIVHSRKDEIDPATTEGRPSLDSIPEQKSAEPKTSEDLETSSEFPLESEVTVLGIPQPQEEVVTTPFEDAPEEKQLDGSTETKDFSTADTSAQKLEAAEVNIEAKSTPRNSYRLSKASLASTVFRTPSPSKTVRSPSPEKSPTRSPERLADPTSPSAKRLSSVAARVKAMEAKAQAQVAAEQQSQVSGEE